MQMWSGGPAGLPCCPQDLPCLDDFARANIEILEMGIKGFCTACVGQADIVAIAGASPGSKDHSVHNGQHRRSLGTGQIHTAVKVLLIFSQGVIAPAIPG